MSISGVTSGVKTKGEVAMSIVVVASDFMSSDGLASARDATD